MDEVTFFNDKGTLVTSTRVEVAGQTFAVRNISSVKLVAGRVHLGHLLGFMIGGACLLAQNWGWAAVVIFATGAWAYGNVRERALVLVTNAGEVKALVRRDPPFMEQVREAVGKAISQR